MELPFEPYDFFGYIASGLVLVSGAQLTLGFPKVFGAELKPFDLAVTVLGVYILGQIAAGPSRFLLEDLVIFKIIGSPTKHLLAPSNHRRSAFFFPGYYKPLPHAVRMKLAAKIAAMQLPSEDPEDIFLTVRYSPSVLGNERLIAKIDGFRDKYGFNRNVAFSLFVASPCFFVAAHFRANKILTHLGIAFLVAALLLFYRFLKFFRQYSYEMFNSFAQMEEKGKP